jgi:hypothetical protein
MSVVLQSPAMPPQAVELEVLRRVSVLLHEVANAVDRYTDSVEDSARAGNAPAVTEGDLGDLAVAWNSVGDALVAIQGAPADRDRPREDLTSIEANLAAVRDIILRQT